ncbi:MAG: peptidase S10 [Cyclobacteriaceae bacterium]|nr:peptidase S10 [Cyclobacteriaceae bacterium]MCB0500621.1 peptidase S10 [Cyclobacteriaceae bacterium]MCB9236330.1 peptidase S10 [Flammeovirgaceae bacterium]MCO5272735.1 peptidase S10 [Cyclobacteriaceae bacterium]MCW5902174.1 peptidase S10 [Cyclobacteriaceae bacterium]
MKSMYAIALFLFCSLLANAQDTGNGENKKEKDKPIPPPKEFVTSHQGTFGGKLIKYNAIAGETYLKDKEGMPVASIWSVTYKLDGPEDANRPVTFVFNGGPGSASVWLHMGFFGPQVTKVDSDASEDDGGAPYPLVNNDHALLDLTDLVFIDPVGTGYSRVVGKGKVEDYWGLIEDARSIATFMREWVTKNKRWNSPKYIAGESFGTTRAAAVAYELEGDGQEMALNGLVLISQALDYQGSTSTFDNIVSYVTYFPSMAATAWYHKKAGQGKTLEAFVEEARKFALDEYVEALYKGSRLTNDERDRIADRMVYFTGLSKKYIQQADLRLLMPRFRKELLRDEGITIGQLDGRYKGEEYDGVADRATLGDPASYSTDGAYTAILNHYYASQLHVEMDRPYITSNGELGPKWRWRDVPEGRYYEPSYVNVARKLGDSMRRNKDLKVMVACGYYDLICPFFDAEYTFARNGILKNRVTLTYYEAGHMMYLHGPDLVKLATDIRKFLTTK